jgi:hypothetical protein
MTSKCSQFQGKMEAKQIADRPKVPQNESKMRAKLPQKDDKTS